MGIENVGVRLVVENLGGFTSAMNQVNGLQNQTVSSLGSLTSVYEKANVSQDALAKSAQVNMRPALSAMRSLFYTASSAIMFFMSTQENMSASTRTLMKVISGTMLVFTGLTSLYRIYAARVAIATAITWAQNAAMAAGTPIAVAFGLAVESAIWPFTLLALAIAAVIAAVYLLIKNWSKIIELFRRTPEAVKELRKSISEAKESVDSLSNSLEAMDVDNKVLEGRLKDLTTDYNYAKTTALGYRGAIKMLETSIKESEVALSALKDAVAEANAELNELSRPRLAGMQQYEDQIFSLDQQIKKLQLQQLQGMDNSQAIEDLERQRNILQLQSEIEFDPLTRQATEAVETINGLNDELTSAAVMARIKELGQSITEKTDQMTYYQTNIDSLTGNLAEITTTVDATLGVMENNINLLNDALYRSELQIRATSEAAALAAQNLSYLESIQNNPPGEYDAGGKSNWEKVKDWFAKIGDDLTPNMPARAFGGMTYSPQVRVGERGPEVVTLPTGSMVRPNTYNTSYNINAQYSNPQQPASIAMDLEYILMRSRGG